MLSFPSDFLWGVSTSAHQFEGGAPASQWVDWEERGRIRSGHSRGSACGWWGSAEGDLKLCRELGLNAIRISVDWARIEPDEQHWNDEAIASYRKFLQSIRACGMRPLVTLHHFTHPLWFEKLGGFLNTASPEYFAAFAERIVLELSDLCSDWLTFNEPNVYCAFGYVFGEFPPGQRYQLRDCATAFARMHSAHALAYQRIHRIQPKASVGLATNWVEFKPATNSVSDRLLAYTYDAAFNRSTFSLLSSGSLEFPFGALAPVVPEAMQKVDFIGLNVYNRLHVRSPWDEAARRSGGLFVPDDAPQGDHGVELPYGEAFPDAIVSAATEYSQLGVPLYITENGVPDREDRIRPWLLVQSLRRTHDLIASGTDLRGYFHWSLVDNFEWSEGWTLRFGLYALDPATQERRARSSANLFQEIIRQNGISDEQLSRFSDPPVPTAARVP
jgi:beta-glucosidase